MNTIRVYFRDGSHEDLAEDTPAHGAVPILPAQAVDAPTLESVRRMRPTADRVWVWQAGQWREGMFEMFQQQIDRLTRERDDARRIAVLDRKPLTAEEYAELRTLVEAAKREGWLK